MPLLEIRNVTRRFGSLTAIDNVTLSIEAGEFFTLLGPSGCGKTTLLRLIAGFDAPDAGSIWLDGKDLANKPPEQRPVHTVFQSYALFPHMSVARNVAFPLAAFAFALNGDDISIAFDARIADEPNAWQFTRLTLSPEHACAIAQRVGAGARAGVRLFEWAPLRDGARRIA